MSYDAKVRVTGAWDRRGPGAVDVGWLAFAVAVTTVVAVVDALVPETVLTGLLVVGPALASARLSPRWTALICGYALFLALELAFRNVQPAVEDRALRLVVLVIGFALAVFLSRSRTERERSLAGIARVVQEALLLPFSARVRGAEIAVRYRSADRDALVGGDLYDVANTGYGLRILVGDARGKGLSATVTAAVALRVFRNNAYTEPTLGGLAAVLDSQLSGLLEPEDFVTAVVAEFGPGGVTVVNCGHHPPVLLEVHPAYVTPEATAPPLGMGFHTRPEPVTVRLRSDQAVLFYTDGLAEARDAAGHMLDVLAASRGLAAQSSLESSLDSLVDRLDAHTGGRRDDDVALLCARLDGPGDRRAD